MINLRAIHFFHAPPPNGSYWFYWKLNNQYSPRDQDVATTFCQLIDSLGERIV